MPRAECLIAIFAIIILATPQTNAKVDPETRRIRLVLFGEGWSVTPHIMMMDPKVAVVVIPAGDATVAAYMARFMRIYMPRTYEGWINQVDVFMLSDLVPWGFSDTHFLWMRRSIDEEGMGMILSEMGWYGATDWTGNACEDWTKTTLYEAYPCDMILGEQNRPCGFLNLIDVPPETVEETGPFLALPGFEGVSFGDHQGVHVPRPGGVTWARYRLGGEAAIVTRRYGKGMTVANSMGMERFVSPYYEWKYYKDYFVSHVYMAGRVRIPEDLELVHRVREQLETFRDHRSLIIGMISFIDRFNANTRTVEQMLAETAPMRKEAEGLFIDQRYEESSSVLIAATRKFDEINEAAIRLRNQALLWVYIIEWLVVSATSLIAGIIIWTLMVRRMLYRQVGVTRSASADEGLDESR